MHQSSLSLSCLMTWKIMWTYATSLKSCIMITSAEFYPFIPFGMTLTFFMVTVWGKGPDESCIVSISYWVWTWLCTPTQEAESLPVLREEAEEAEHSLKAGKSPGVDHIPSARLKNGGEATTVLTAICQKIWGTKEWLKEWTQSLIIPLAKKGYPKQCQNYCTITQISHSSNIMLWVIINRLKARARNGWQKNKQVLDQPEHSEQIFNSWDVIEKHLQHQWDLFYNFIDFKKAFNRVWHAGLWRVLRSFDINELVQAIQALYENSSRAVILNSQLGEFFKTTVGVYQGCLLSLILFNLFLEKIIQKTFPDHHASISIGWKHMYNLQFANDIDLMGSSKDKLQDFTSRLIDRATAYGMEVKHRKEQGHDQQHEQYQCIY